MPDDTGEQARSVYLLGTWDLSRGGVNGATRLLTVNIHRWVAKLAVDKTVGSVLGACRKTGVSLWDTWDGSPWSAPLLRGRRGTMRIAKGSDVRPGVPWSPRLLRGRRGTMRIAKGSDIRPSVPWSPRFFAWQAWGNVHRQGVGCTPWRLLVSASFENVYCQGVGCTPWRPLVSVSFVYRHGTMCTAKGSDICPGIPWSPPLLCGRRGTMCTAKGSDARAGVPWFPPLLRARRGTISIAKGSDIRPGVPCFRLFCVPGMGQYALPRGRIHALASLGPPYLCGRRGTMRIAKGSDARPSVPWFPHLLCGRRGIICIAKGSDVRPGVP